MAETQKEEMWNYLCGHCGWRGVAQELMWHEHRAEYTCPICFQSDHRQTEWHLGNRPLKEIKRHS